MRLPVFFIAASFLTACGPNPMDNFDTVECSMFGTSLSANAINDYIDEMEEESVAPAEISVVFGDWRDDDERWTLRGAIEAPTEAFAVTSVEPVDDGTNDLTFEVDLSLAKTAQPEVADFFNDNSGNLHIDDSAGVWLNIYSNGHWIVFAGFTLVNIPIVDEEHVGDCSLL